MTKRLAVLVALLTAALVSGCSTAAPAPTPTKAPAAPTATQAAAPTKAAAPTTVAAPTAAPATKAPASSYPDKPITLIEPYAVGSGTDVVVRPLAIELEKELGQKIVVENKAGGGSVIGLSEIAAAKPDGYTIGWAGMWAINYLPLIQEAPFTGMADFTPIAQIHMNNGLTTVRADSPWKTLQDLYDDAKKRPGKITWGLQAGLKGLGHVQAIQIAKPSGATFNFIPLNTTGMADLLGGTIDVVHEGEQSAGAQIKAGKARPLFIAYMTENLRKEYPNHPTAESLKIPLVMSTSGFVGPKGLPADVLAKWDAAVKKVMASKAFIDRENQMGVVIMYMGPEEMKKDAAAKTAVLKEIAAENGWLLKKN